MKQLMLGNAAVARGLYEAGCGVVSSYPGTPSTEITEECAKYDEIYCEWAPNEKVAMEVAFGASLAGKRSFCGMKHVGLNVAADPLFTMSYTGVNGGMVIGVADDAGMHSSQNEQDSRHYARAAKVPMLEPSDSAEALAFAKLAYELSEQFDTPVLLKMCTRVAHSQSIVDTTERAEREMIPYEKNIAKYVMMPGNAKRRHPVVEERTRKLAQWAETAPVNRVEEGADHKIGIITSSTSYQYVKEVCGDRFPVLKLGMAWPLPEGLIRDFAASVDLLTVVEELDGFIEAHCRAMGLALAGKDVFPCIDEFSQNLVAEKLGLPVHAGRKLDDQIPPRPPVMCAGCPHRGLFYTLNKNKCTVLGDIGCYTLGAVAPLSAMDMTLCMGGSISAIHGFNKARGGESECRAMGFRRVRVVDPYDLKETDRAVKEELAADEPSVIISRRPCALLKYVKHKAPLKVNTDKCIGCKSCMKIGCPAISMKEGKAHVDFTQCVGCGVCQQLCLVGAYESTGKVG